MPRHDPSARGSRKRWVPGKAQATGDLTLVWVILNKSTVISLPACLAIGPVNARNFRKSDDWRVPKIADAVLV